MRIESVQLENIRSHVKSTVYFTKGFNCLVGGLGCGKSSVLYAIDFGLFGDPAVGRSYDYLLREGAESGKVIVRFSQDGKTYAISRGLRRRGKGISQDLNELKLFEGENIIASAKSDAVAEQLNAITGLDKELFREVVWVKQERLKELLDAPSRDRQKRLDELFGLSDYELAWNNIAEYQREYEGERKAYEKDPDVVGIEKLSAEYNRTVEELSLLEIELQSSIDKLETAKKALEEADLRLKELENAKAYVDEIKREEAKLQANVMNVKGALVTLAKGIEDKKASVESLKQRLSSVEAQIELYRKELREIGVQGDQPIEALRQYLKAFEDQITGLRAEQEAAVRNLQADQRRISSLSAESRCPLCLQPLSDEYKNGLMRKIREESDERQKLINQLQQDVEELQRIKDRAYVAVSNLQTLTMKLEELRAQMGDELNALTELSNELQEKQTLKDELCSKLGKIRAEISEFDISELENARKRRELAFRQYCFLESDLRSKENRKRDLKRRLDELKVRVDEAQRKIERVEKISKVIGIISDMRDAYRSIQPKLRGEFVKALRSFVQQVLNSLTGGEGPQISVTIDEAYAPYVLSEEGIERDVSNLSGGERTLLAFAYRFGLGQLIMQSRTGRGLSMLLLDEPTESLGREDGSVDRLAEAISRFKAVEQIIAVTHSEAFAEKAEHVVRLEKEAGVSKVLMEK